MGVQEETTLAFYVIASVSHNYYSHFTLIFHNIRPLLVAGFIAEEERNHEKNLF